jgi:hypothetical protein
LTASGNCQPDADREAACRYLCTKLSFEPVE